MDIRTANLCVLVSLNERMGKLICEVPRQMDDKDFVGAGASFGAIRAYADSLQQIARILEGHMCNAAWDEKQANEKP